MLDQILDIDQSLFRLVNQGMENSFFNFVMPLITEGHKNIYFQIFIALVAIITIYKYRTRAILIWLGLILTVAAADWIGHNVIKPFFGRIRPSQTFDVILRAQNYFGLSFTSNHASNSFAAAFYLSQFIGYWRLLLYIYAAMIAFSRVYVGVHYPADVLCGALWGGLFGYFIGKMWSRVCRTS